MTGEQNGADTPVVLFSYRRPELTRAAIQRIADSWTGPVIVSIDGLRSAASAEEKEWRDGTIRVAEQEASRYAHVEVQVWEANRGLTDHALRIFQYVMENHRSLIALEEDIAVSPEGLSWLARVSAAEQPVLATAMTRFEHPGGSASGVARLTAFPSQWSSAFNTALFQEFIRIWRNRSIDRRVVNDVVDTVISSRTLAWSARDYWHSLFRNAAASASHGDALFQYASWSLGCLTSIPVRNAVRDLGPSDFRGLHQRMEPDDIPAIHEFHPISWVGDSRVCASCEILSQDRWGVGVWTPLRRRLRLRSRVKFLFHNKPQPDSQLLKRE
jgi:hypothetical protein